MSSKSEMSLLITLIINRVMALVEKCRLLERYLIPDVIGNLTALRTLDLSYNDISDISDRDVFTLPLNLTNLLLSNNHLSHVPLDKILPLPNLKILDVEDNEIGVFDERFMKIIQNNTVLRYSGNKLNN